MTRFVLAPNDVLQYASPTGARTRIARHVPKGEPLLEVKR